MKRHSGWSLCRTVALSTTVLASIALTLPAQAEWRHRGGGYRHHDHGDDHAGLAIGAALLGAVAGAALIGAASEPPPPPVVYSQPPPPPPPGVYYYPNNYDQSPPPGYYPPPDY